MYEHENDSPDAFKLRPNTPNISFNGQPLVLDYNGDQIPDFLGNIDNVANIMQTTTVGNVKGLLEL